MRYAAYFLISLLSSIATDVTAIIGSPCGVPASSYSFSFEKDLEGWAINGTDLTLGSGLIDWSISRSQEMAKDGASSLKFVLYNQNDAGKIWIEKALAVQPNQIYDISVDYAFASRMSAGPFFKIITGVLKNHPSTARDLYPAFKDDTWNGSNSNDANFTWLDKKYDFTIKSDDQGILFVVIGIWGTWEVLHTYYFDDVRVTFTKKPDESEFDSFENDFQGWSPKGADLELGSGFVDWSITRVEEYALEGEDGISSLKFDLNSLNEKAKIWIEKPFAVRAQTKYRVTVDYALHSHDCGHVPRFTIITGVFRRQPETGEDLADALQETTESTGCTWGWLHKKYDFTIKSKRSDALYVVIGISGSQQAHRTYNVDSVCVSLTEK